MGTESKQKIEFDVMWDVPFAARALGTGIPHLAGKDVLVCVPDRTREFEPSDTLLPLLEGLFVGGAAPERVTVAIASGSHVASDADVARLGALPRGVRILRHDPDGPSALAGTTSSGTEVRVNPALLEAGIVCAIGPVAFHYFAGFGGGGKLLFPGLGARASIAANHRLSLAPEWGLAEGVEPGRLEDNPVARDLREAHVLLPEAHHLTLGDRLDRPFAVRWSDYTAFDGITRFWSLDRRTEPRHGCGFVVGESHGPHAIDVVQAHKALLHASLFARDDAELVLIADCPEGIGSPALAEWLSRPSRARLEADARSAYDLNAQTAISLAAIAERTRVTWVTPQSLPLLERWGIRIVHHMDDVSALVDRYEGHRIISLLEPTRCLPADPRLVARGLET